MVTFLLLPLGLLLTHLSTLPTSFFGHPLIQMLWFHRSNIFSQRERGKKKVTCSIISDWTFDLTFTEEAEKWLSMGRHSRLGMTVYFRTGEVHAAGERRWCVRIITAWQHRAKSLDKAKQNKWSDIDLSAPAMYSYCKWCYANGSFTVKWWRLNIQDPAHPGGHGSPDFLCTWL